MGCSWRSIQIPSVCSVVPLHDTIGRVLSGDLCTFIVRYMTPNGLAFGSFNDDRKKLHSCLFSTCFHLWIQASRSLMIRVLTYSTWAGRIRW